MKKLTIAAIASFALFSVMQAQENPASVAGRQNLTVRVEVSSPVDMGLGSGLKWSYFNLGTNAPEKKGSLFAWGETIGYNDTIIHPFTKENYSYHGTEGLKLSQDAAHATWGGFWRMPSQAEVQELLDSCEVKYGTNHEQQYDYQRVTAKNGKELFIPKYMWTSSYDSKATLYKGLPIRPVYDNRPVDLGLPSGTLWMPANVGADSPEGVGKYYAWGETEGFYLNDDISLIRSTYTKDTIFLPVERDAAYVGQSTQLQMPTSEQWHEMWLATDRYQDTINGVPGVLFVSLKNGNSIFFPAGGYINNGQLEDAGTKSYVWLNHGCDTKTAMVGLTLGGFEKSIDKNCGFPIRGVVRKYGIRIFPFDLTIRVGSSFNLTYTKDVPGGVTWESSNKEIADVDAMGTVTAKGVGQAVITVWESQTGARDRCVVTIIDNLTRPDQVDMGLPSGIKWGRMNIGATTPFETGDYFAWGESKTKGNFNLYTYVGPKLEEVAFGLNQDAATCRLGGNWRTPTEEEWEELLANSDVQTTNMVTEQNKTSFCYVLTSKLNGETLYIPESGVKVSDWVRHEATELLTATGYKSGTSSLDYYSMYAASLKKDETSGAITTKVEILSRCLGRAIRPVYDDRGVDLDLPSGTLWMPANLGGKKENDKGKFYRWGEIYGHESPAPLEGTWNISFDTTDHKLPAGYDAVTFNYGSSWHLPTPEQIEELKTHCSSKWEYINNVLCVRYEGRNGKSIIIPAAGGYFSRVYTGSNESWLYWTNAGTTKKAIAWGGVFPATQIAELSPIAATCALPLRGVKDATITQLWLPVAESEIVVGNKQQLKYVVTPKSYASDLEWASSDDQVVTVDNQGVVTAVKVGSATITVSYRKNNFAMSSECKIRVVAVPSRSQITKISVTPHSTTIPMGEQKAFMVRVEPDTLPQRGVWYSSKPDVASVNNLGVVNALSKGNATIYVTSDDGTNLSDSCEVVVTEPEHITRVQLYNTVVNINEKMPMSVIIEPRKFGREHLLWQSSDTTIATIDAYGNLQGRACGRTTITVTAKDDAKISSKCIVRVIRPYSDLGLKVKWACQNYGANSMYDMGTTDGSDDGLSSKWGKGWQKPTQEMWDELKNECTWVWSEFQIYENGEYKNVMGYWIYGTKPGYTENAIFLPTTDKNLDDYMIRNHIRPVAVSRPMDPVMVDMGLSVLWADINLGAFSESDYGFYYAWGETAPKVAYNWTTYQQSGETEYSIQKYCTNENFGKVDGSWTLLSNDDAARSNWGGTWRMPTKAEYEELQDPTKCTWKWYSAGNKEYNGVAGYRVESLTTQASIFLPAAGVMTEMGQIGLGKSGTYWSSTLNKNTPCYSWYLCFDPFDLCYGYYYRYEGRTIRPVADYK